MRIAILTTSYPQEDGDPSGHFVETEARVLASAGHDVHVIAPGPQGAASDGGAPNVWGAGASKLFGLPGALLRVKERPLRLLELGGFARRVRRTLARLAPLDRMIAHFLVPSGYPLALGCAPSLEVVAHGSDVRLLAGLPRAVRTHVIRKLLGSGAELRFVSQNLRDLLIDALPAPLGKALLGSSSVAPSPIAIPNVAEHARRARVSLALPPGEGLWVVVGRLIASKRVDLAIREAVRARATLVVVGDGPERRALERLTLALGGRVVFLGHRPRPEALAWIASADRLVHLSEAEGAPTVIREARALGTPVLAAPVGDVAMWAEEDPGIHLQQPAEVVPRC